MRPILLLATLHFAAACADAPAGDGAVATGDAADGSGTPGAFGGQPVARALAFRSYRVISVSGGRSEGFDLDGQQAGSGSPDDCGQSDAVAPDGTQGIDNGVGQLWTDFYDVVGASQESLFREGLSRGGQVPLLVLPDDASSRFATARYDGASVDFDGLLASYQTFDTNGSGLPVPASVTSDILRFGPAEVSVEVEVFVLTFELPIGAFQGELHRGGDGTWRGVVGGAFPVAAIPAPLGAVGALANGQPLSEALAAAADLGSADGSCGAISFAAEVEAVESFVVAPR